ncbi:2-amino-4-hydroxy-6-hydroxymethyldihydropteridine diphosphokinase [Psychrobacter sp. I-STPA6b]|uniref:2-amino-4-hydroxy-6- hydroxymethyldihydropteridine diphosphokinase n=1 Tax=Psychrobacter sp. I-STPA6b TaxID=2585718 RepID=UPI001D0C9EAE|nr:2-amino-4-hydroxy-6-hydroxymethyldihydropteridine diphosphokinase [Psychrobacter sp. I-STPA6b]
MSNYTSYSPIVELIGSRPQCFLPLCELPLAKLLPHQVPIAEVVLSLGSNHQATQHLAYAQQALYLLGHTVYSPLFKNPDFTATVSQPKPDYTNQCVSLQPTSIITLKEFIHTIKQIELQCQRQRTGLANNEYLQSQNVQSSAIKLVTLDIDLLALQFVGQSQWYRLAERFPFKAHEWKGLQDMGLNSVLA